MFPLIKSAFCACVSFILLTQISDGLNCSDWCVASNEAPDNVVQKGLDWVCQYGLQGACDSIQRSEPCYIPNDLRGVASVVFNQYWQTIKHSGYVCDKLLDGATTLVHTDPSRPNCTIPCT
ncbi:unnamed protein product [Amaranthus hypochondriacus]